MVLTTQPGSSRRTTQQKGAPASIITGAQMLWESLLSEGVDTIFGYPGGQVIPLYHHLPDYPLRHVLVRHEQAAAHAADGYARATGRTGVCVATSGPGATNLVTGLATAYLDSSPLVAITGQVPTSMLGRNSFQEVNTCGITQDVTKVNYLITNVAEVGPVLRDAFRVARAGKPGPVLVDMPRDVQTARGEFVPSPGGRDFASPADNPQAVRQLAGLLRSAERPLILAGRGVNLAGANSELRRLAEESDTPVVSTLLGLGALPGSHSNFLGLVGMHGRPSANRALCACDLLIIVGTRLGDRTTGNKAGFARQAKIVHVDVDPAEIGKNVGPDLPVVGDAKRLLASLLAEGVKGNRAGWRRQVEQWRVEETQVTPPRNNGWVSPRQVLETLDRQTGGEAFVVTDVGQHQLWAAQYYTYDRPGGFISSGGLGTMGFGLPAAIGAKLGRPQDAVWLVCGDGGFQMNIQELATMVQEGAAVKIALLNNGYLGMVRQWQELFFERRYSSTPLLGPDFVRVVEAYGVPARRVERDEGVAEALRWASEVDGPAFVEFVINPEENVLPMVPPGGSLDNMVGA
jgi:acetolactate synthase I/II/III large subunit